ncbi:MAG TPA: PPC domain-containing DNA-binding protein [Longimicrobiales bacterium]
MQQRQTPFGHVLVLEPGEDLVRCLIAFARREEVEAAVLYGIGAVGRVELGWYDTAAQEYGRREIEEPLEVCAMMGNLALLDGEPFPHVHGVFGRKDFTTVGGHIFEAVCSVTLEVAVHTAPVALVRGPVDFCNLNLLKLEKTS